MSTWRKVGYCLAMVAGLSFGAAAKEITIDSYVQDGLIAQWDGIENVGKGEAHDPNTTVWKDLAGERDLTLVSGNASFTSNALVGVSRSSGKMATGAAACTTYKTIEVVIDKPTATTVLMGAGDAYHFIATHNGNVQAQTGSPLQKVDESGTYAFVYDENDRPVKFYQNGIPMPVVAGSDGWAIGNELWVGAYGDGRYPFVGNVYAIRLYDRALSEDDLVANATVDQVRFFGFSFVSKVSISAESGGEVSLNGGAWAQSAELVLDKGEEVVVACRPAAGYAFRRWSTSDSARRFVEEVQFSFVLNEDFTARAMFRDMSSSDRTANDYKFDGLMAMWDGIENVGLGLAHDEAATVWKDLVGTCDFSLVEGQATWTSNSIVRVGGTSAIMAKANEARANFKTIEVVCDVPTKPSFVFGGQDGNHFLASRSGSVQCKGGPLYLVGTANTYAFVYDENGGVTFYADGVMRNDTSGSDSWSNVGNAILGAYRDTGATYAYEGNVYCIRLYDRALTPGEIYSNVQVDGARYFGRPIVEHHMYVNVRGGGKVAVDGGAAEVSHTLTPQIGDVLPLEAVADEGWSFVAWETADGSLYSTNAISPVIDYAVNEFCTLTAVFVETAKVTDTDATRYVHDGILAMWDGIANAGYGKPHDSAATVWKDLVSSCDAQLVDGNAEFAARSLVCSSRQGGVAASLPGRFLTVKTIEVVCTLPTGHGAFAFYSGSGPFMSFVNGKALGVNAGDLHLVSTNLATYAFTYGGTLPAFYENGAQRMQISGKDNFGSSLSAAIGANPGSQGYCYVGDIYAIRVYDRVLTAGELAHNADLDQARFFDAPPICGTREFRIRLAAEKGGRIAVTGGTKIGEGEYVVREGRPFSLEAIPRAAHVFTGWRDPLGAYVNVANVLSNRIELTAFCETEITAGFGARAAYVSSTATDYVRDGLLAQWDGIENAGLGLAHEDSAIVWKDLASTNDLDLVGGNGSFAGNALVCSGGGIAACSPGREISSFKTIEVVCDANLNSGFGIVFCGGIGVETFLVTDAKTFDIGPSYLFEFSGNPTTLAVRNATDFFADGVRAQRRPHSDGWNNNDRYVTVGARPGGSPYSYKGNIYAIRVYDRALTDAELARNFLLDSIRFFGRERPKKPGSVLIVR